jgi:hypothetical protein
MLGDYGILMFLLIAAAALLSAIDWKIYRR